MWNNGEIDENIQVASSGNYSVEARLGDCFMADTVNVNFQAPGDINFGGDTILCQGDILVLVHFLFSLCSSFFIIIGITNLQATNHNHSMHDILCHYIKQGISPNFLE